VGAGVVMMSPALITELWDGGWIWRIALVGVLVLFAYLQWDWFIRKERTNRTPTTSLTEGASMPTYPSAADYSYGSAAARERAREILAMSLEVNPDQVVNSFFEALMASGYEIVGRKRIPSMSASFAEVAKLEQELMDRGAATRATVSSSGGDLKDELFTVFETTGVFAGFADVHAGYAALVDDPDHGMEALKRALFLQWYARAEPGYITGIHRLYAESEWAVLQQLERRLIGLRTEPWEIEDEELICMLDCYDDIFGRYLRSLEAFPALQSYLTETDTLTIAGDVIVDVWLDHEARSRILMAAGWDVVPRLATDDWLRDRGQMGVYFTSMLEWLVTTRPVDLTDRPAPYPTRDIVIIQADRFMQHLSALGPKRVRGEPFPYGYMMCAPPGDWAEIAELLDGPETDPDESHIRHVVRNAKDAEVVGIYLAPARLAEVFRAIEQLDRHRSLVEKDEV
jgi:hypothetical protein